MLKYKGAFNWFGEIIVVWTTATSHTKAFHNFCKTLEKKIGYSYNKIKRYFTGSNKYEIKEMI
jgi:hypothetical protein